MKSLILVATFCWGTIAAAANDMSAVVRVIEQNSPPAETSISSPEIINNYKDALRLSLLRHNFVKCNIDTGDTWADDLLSVGHWSAASRGKEGSIRILDKDAIGGWFLISGEQPYLVAQIIQVFPTQDGLNLSLLNFTFSLSSDLRDIEAVVFKVEKVKFKKLSTGTIIDPEFSYELLNQETTYEETCFDVTALK